MSQTYEKIKSFKRKYPLTIAWRLKQHCKIMDMHVNPGEKISYIFAAQKSESVFSLFSTYAVALTDKRLLIGTKRLLFGYFFTAITPDMFNDLAVRKGILWGRVTIDTIKEVVVLSNIDPNALDEIETNITEKMIKEKKKYGLSAK